MGIVQRTGQGLPETPGETNRPEILRYGGPKTALVPEGQTGSGTDG